MPKSVEVELSGKKYTIRELPSRKNMEWRKKLSEEFGDLARLIEQAPGLEINSGEGMAQLGQMVSVFVGKVSGSIEILRGLLFDYSSELGVQRENLEANGYDSEFIAAFVEVLKLAYPFGALTDLATAAVRKAGQQTKTT